MFLFLICVINIFKKGMITMTKTPDKIGLYLIIKNSIDIIQKVFKEKFPDTIYLEDNKSVYDIIDKESQLIKDIFELVNDVYTDQIKIIKDDLIETAIDYFKSHYTLSAENPTLISFDKTKLDEYLYNNNRFTVMLFKYEDNICKYFKELSETYDIRIIQYSINRIQSLLDISINLKVLKAYIEYLCNSYMINKNIFMLNDVTRRILETDN